MDRCGANTSTGKPCRRIKTPGKDTCALHEDSKECSICLNPIITKSHRNTRTLSCNHTFHLSCIDRWKRQGRYTCPVCRSPFDIPVYSVTVILESRITRERLVTPNIVGSHEVGTRMTELFDLPRDGNVEFVTNINIEAEDDDALIDVLTNDLGIDISQINLPSNINVPGGQGQEGGRDVGSGEQGRTHAEAES